MLYWNSAEKLLTYPCHNIVVIIGAQGPSNIMPVCSIDSDKPRKERERARENINIQKSAKNYPVRQTPQGKKENEELMFSSYQPLWQFELLSWTDLYIFLLCISSNVFRRYVCLSGAFSWLDLLCGPESGWTQRLVGLKAVYWVVEQIVWMQPSLPSLRRWIVTGYFMLLHAFATEFHF